MSFEIHKKLHKYLNTSESRVLVEKYYKPKCVIHNHNASFYYHYHKNGIKKYVLTMYEDKFLEETFFNTDGQLHRDNDLPAWITLRKVCYYNNGNLHRSFDEPAVIKSDGSVEYWVNGILHRKKINKRVAISKLIKRFWKEFKKILLS